MLVVGRNCWRVARADRAAFLIDADAYFTAFRQVVGQARERVIIMGWDVDSRVRLDARDPGSTLLSFLNQTLARRPGLSIHVLAWDFSVLFALEREPLPAFRFAWNADPRLRFQLDDAHPFSGSHHQKIVAVDGRVAFAGGLDLAIRRWDTPAHDAHDPRRVDPAGHPYPPTHDVQMIVEGEAAAALDELARARWRAATGQAVPAAAAGAPEVALWPEGLEPDVRDAPVGIARTAPAFRDAPPIGEVAMLTLDAIASARRWLYIENQYLTSAAAGAALARRLEEPDGPEIVIVLPREEHGWLEQRSMGIMRARVLRRLLDSDRHGRLRLLHPVVPNLDAACVNLHDKVMIVDDAIARVGSANLSNRSMGLDTECDLVLDAALDAGLARPIAGLRSRLLAEHLGTTPQAVDDALAARGSLIATIAALSGGGRTLIPLPTPSVDEAGALRPDAAAAMGGPPVDLTFLDGLVCDPERPAPDQLLATFVPEGLRRPVHRSLTGWVLGLVALLVLAALWRLTPLRTLLDPERIAALGRAVRSHPAAPLWVLLGYVAGGLVFFPITLLLGATALLFPTPGSIIYCLGGTLASAALTYGVGRLTRRLGSFWLHRPRLLRLRAQLLDRGLLAIIAARMLPVGNFSLINMAAGALGVRFRDFMLGNLIGVLPGVLALTLFADRLSSTLRHPHARNVILLAVLAALLFLVMWWLRRRLARRAAP